MVPVVLALSIKAPPSECANRLGSDAYFFFVFFISLFVDFCLGSNLPRPKANNGSYIKKSLTFLLPLTAIFGFPS